MRRPRSQQEELEAFSRRVTELTQAGQPVKVQVGFGWTPAPGFLNLDVQSLLAEGDRRFDDCEVFYVPYVEKPWPIPDGTVDFIFHEDFIEHISQKQQVCFLAETLRVLKHGGWHRISTPCLQASMKRRSEFGKGMRGVYTGEWDNWEHICLFTRQSLEEMARMVGYRDVTFNGKNLGVSPYSLRDERRPGADRDPIFGNISADLLKFDPVRAERRVEAMLPLFDEDHYLKVNRDVAEVVQKGTFASGRDHYIRFGFAARRVPYFIDEAWYAQQYPLAAQEVAQGSYNDFFDHYALVGQARGYRTKPE